MYKTTRKDFTYMKKERLKYSQLCEKFNENEKPRGLRRDRQFERWRREWHIERDGNSYYYIVYPLNMKDKLVLTKNNNIVNISNKDYLEPMIFEQMSKNTDEYWDATPLERQQALGLVNDDYRITLSETQKQIFANDNNMLVADVSTFGQMVYEINRVTITNIRDGMKKKGYLNYEKAFKIRYKSDNPNVVNNDIYVTGEQMQEIENCRNEMTRIITNGRLNTFYSVRDKELREQIREAVNEQLGLDYHTDAERWWKDNKSINIAFNKDYSYKLNKIRVNENNQMKIYKSKRGGLKDIGNITKSKLIDCFIDIKEIE